MDDGVMFGTFFILELFSPCVLDIGCGAETFMIRSVLYKLYIHMSSLTNLFGITQVFPGILH